jgi:hyperosmotically inducible protein
MRAPNKVLGVMLVAGLVQLGLASVAATASTLNDVEIQAEIEKKLDKKDIMNGGGPWVGVDNGFVTLRGKVKSVWAKNEAVKLAMEVDDVAAVEDELEIAFGESDEKVGEEVAKKVRSYAYFTVYDDVNLGVEEGNVLLTGRVTMPHKSKAIEERASKVMGVQSVTNEIKTLPISIHDQRLRAALTYRIYGDPMFREYASRINPPIHIIVERGRVELTGAVRSNVERVKAEHIARQTFGVFKVENRLTVGG